MIKNIYISIFLLLVLFLVSCTDLDNYVPIEDYNKLQNAFNESIDDITGLKKDNSSLKSEKQDLENRLNLTEEQLEKYKYLLDNLNNLLSNVYYGYANNASYETIGGFTAFSLEYNDIFYLITAGHCVHYDYGGIDSGLYTYFKFKANLNDDWIYPKLLLYENDFENNRDYAILYSDKIDAGLKYDLNNNSPKFILGNTNKNILKEFDIYNLIEGESGSPIIDLDGEVIELATGNYIDIDLIIEAIDNLE